MKKAMIMYICVVCLFGVLLACSVILRHDKDILLLPQPVPPVEDDTYRIDLNTATADDFQKIPGVGPALAQSIVTYRSENGPFTQYDELLNVKGIGTAKLMTILKYVRIK